LVDAHTRSAPADASVSYQSIGCADRILDLYGLQELLVDIDNGREFWREGGGIVGAILEWVTGAGFDKFFERYEGKFPWRSALEFRQRFITQAMRGLQPSG
jgi:hypothetical protein